MINNQEGARSLCSARQTSVSTIDFRQQGLTKTQSTNLQKPKHDLQNAKKAAESVTKTTKSQARHNLVDITADDVDHIKSTLHGNTEVHGHPVADDTSLEDLFDRIAGLTDTFEEHKRSLARELANQRRTNNAKQTANSDEMLDLSIDGALLRLGVDNNHLNSPVLQQATLASTKKTPLKKGPDGIINRLRSAIKDDMQKHENELRQVFIRAEGFYRYAGRTVFERLRGIAGEAERRNQRRGNERPDDEDSGRGRCQAKVK